MHDQYDTGPKVLLPPAGDGAGAGEGVRVRSGAGVGLGAQTAPLLSGQYSTSIGAGVGAVGVGVATGAVGSATGAATGATTVAPGVVLTTASIHPSPHAVSAAIAMMVKKVFTAFMIHSNICSGYITPQWRNGLFFLLRAL